MNVIGQVGRTNERDWTTLLFGASNVYLGAVMLSPSDPAHHLWKNVLSGAFDSGNAGWTGTPAGIGGGQGVAGAVEEIRVWSRALSVCEVEALLRFDYAALDFSASLAAPAGTGVAVVAASPGPSGAGAGAASAPAVAAAQDEEVTTTTTASVMLPAGFLQSPFAISAWVYLREDGDAAGRATTVFEAAADDSGPAAPAAPAAVSLGVAAGSFTASVGLGCVGVAASAGEPCDATRQARGGAAAVGAGRWHHLAASYDGHAWRLAVDGVHRVTTSFSKLPAQPMFPPALPVVPLPTSAPPDRVTPPTRHELVLAPPSAGGVGVEANVGGSFARFTGAVFDLRLDRGASVPVTAAAFSRAVACPPAASLADGGAYYPLNEGSGEASRAITSAAASASSAAAAATTTTTMPPADLTLGAASSTWTNATFTTPVATIRVDGDLSTVDGARRCFSAAAVSACGAVVTSARGFAVSFDAEGVEVSVTEYGDGTAVVCYRPVSACGSLVANISLPPFDGGGMGVQDEDTVYVAVAIDSQPGEVSPAQSFVNAVTVSTCEGVPFTVRATARDARGCPVTNGGDLAFTATARGPAAYVDVPMVHTGDGVHEAVYTPEASGYYELSVQAGGVSVGDSRCVFHCVGGSLRFDGYTAAEFNDEDAQTPGWENGLTLQDTAFTVEAWVKRGVRGTAPSPPPPPPSPPPPPRLMEGRRHLQQTGPTTNAASAAQDGSAPVDLSKLRLPDADAPAAGSTDAQLIAHKSGVTSLGDAVFAYYLAFTPDYSHVHAAVYVPGEGINNRGVYRAAQTAEPLPMTSVKCPADPACTPGTDEGWMHVTAAYNGTVLEIYIDGILAGRNSWADVEPEPRWAAPLESYGKLTLGSGWAGQLDEIRVHATALNGAQSVETKRCPARFSNRYGGLGAPPRFDTKMMASVTFNDGGFGGAGAVDVTSATMRRGGGAPPAYAPVAVAGDSPRAEWIARGRPGARTGVAASPITSVVEMGPVPEGGHLVGYGSTHALTHETNVIGRVTKRNERDWMSDQTKRKCLDE